MAIRPAEVFDAMQDRVPYFSPGFVPRSTQLRFLSAAEATITQAAQERDSHFLAQDTAIYLKLTQAMNPGEASAGGFGAFALGEDGSLVYEGGGGFVSRYDLTAPLIAPLVVTGVAGAVVSFAGTPFTVDQWNDYLAVVVAGPGAGALGFAKIDDTATGALTLEDAIDGLVVGRSLIAIFSPSPARTDDRVALGTTGKIERVAYLTKVDANGTAYLDLGDPLIANFDVGIPLPGMAQPLELRGWPLNADRPIGVVYVEPAARSQGILGPAWTVSGGRIFLLGGYGRFERFQNLLLTYQPIPPRIVTWTQALLLPETARTALELQFSLLVATRLARILPEAKIELAELREESASELRTFLNRVQGVGMARPRTVREVF